MDSYDKALDSGRFPEPFLFEQVAADVTEVSMREGFRFAPGGLITQEGGFASRFYNGTGVVIPHGTAVALSAATANGVVPQASEYDCIGIVYGAIAANAWGWVVTAGIAEALLKDGTSATLGYWAKASATDGRVEVTTAPSGLGALSTAEHFKEVGHCMETKSSGTNVLVKIVVHPL